MKSTNEIWSLFKQLKIILPAFLILGYGSALGQYEIEPIHSTQSFYLNNSTRADLGTGDNRACLPVQIPINTVEWYYSFSVSKDSSSANLKLYYQLINSFDPTGISSLAFQAITVPKGQARCNVYVTDYSNGIAFDSNQKSNYFPSASRMNFSHGVVRVKGVSTKELFICFENPAVWKGVTIRVEVDALVKKNQELHSKKTSNDIDYKEKKPASAEKVIDALEELAKSIDKGVQKRKKHKKDQERAKNYWSTGWVFYKSGDFENSIIYTKRALKINKHPGLYFNLGLSQWSLDQADSSTESYLKGINLIYSFGTKEQAIRILELAIKDIKMGMEKFNYFTESPPALELLNIKLNEINKVTKWKKKY